MLQTRKQIEDRGLLLALAGCLLVCHAPSAWAQEPIIIDHHCTDLSQVPAFWIEQAKTQFFLSYGHTSHGSPAVSSAPMFRASTQKR